MTSLRFKIIISTLFIIFLIITGSYIVIQDIQKGIIEGEFRDKGFLMANHLALEFKEPLLVNDMAGIRNYVMNMENSYPDIEYIFVTDSMGNIVANTSSSGFPMSLNMSRPNLMNEYVYVIDNRIIHEFDATISNNTGYVHVGLSENRVRAHILEASRNLLLIAFSGMVLGGLFIYFIGRRLTEPIQDLTEGARRINNGFLEQRIQIKSSDELAVLASTFNDMASSLDKKIKDLLASKEQTETAQKYLETLFDSIDDGIIVLNIKHEIIKSNKSLQRMLGMTEKELLGKTCHEIIFGFKPEQHRDEECPIDNMLKTKTPVRMIHEVNLNGSKKIMDINGSVLSDSGEETNLILVLRDVTQQHALEEEIIERNRSLTLLNEISKNIGETFDIERILSKSLENLLKLTNMERGEAYLIDENSGMLSLKTHVGKDGHIIPEKTLLQIMKKNEVSIIEDLKILPDIETGKNSDVSFAAIPLKLKDKVMGIITLGCSVPHGFSKIDKEIFSSVGNQLGVAIENITFYNNIKYLKEFNEEILNNVNLAIHVVDKDMKILAVNDELVTLSRGRIKKEGMTGKSIYEVFSFLKERGVDKEYEYVLKTGEIFQSEEKTQYFGDIIYTSTTKVPIKDKNGNVEKIITVMKDVTEQKRLEEELKDSYEELRLTYLKLKELYKLKDNFLSGMSHELRTPLTSILGFTELLLEEDMIPEDRHKLEIIFRNSKRLSGLISGLLDTTLIESQGLQLNMQTLSIYDIILNVTDDMKTISSIKNIPIHLKVPQDLIVKGDSERLKQVFSNILDNAIKFTIKGEINIIAEEEDEWVHIKVNDTGIGIPEEKINKIFDRFYQLDTSESQKTGSYGLGLWISKNIVEGHNGKIWAESKNSGSTFHVLLLKGKINE